ncbi:NAD+ synthase [Candidatus Nitrospira allomarina]|uniref:Glutamine-dependent NAD(+) synthetase n=1 Tax=Candidatus Nitrospira allomarina TaxID=3020900 RepID=A0AA96JXV9_9BACT|nr:NAD+ synthase [Candidatus Nitrospira allomarina]WNM59536.1 NAD+ synthase [Candidatus Nitrospira allomarina]
MMIRLAMVQMNAVVGDLEGNTRTICEWIREAKKAKADVVVFPELAVCGYPPEDLLLMPKFLFDISRMRDRITKVTTGIMAVVGSVIESDRPAQHPLRDHVQNRRKPLNAAWVLVNGQAKRSYAKCKLPNYGVFDEERYFQPGQTSPVYCLGPVRIGINICEDIWFADGPASRQAVYGGAHLVLNINASPYHVGKTQNRERMLAIRAKANNVMVSYTNMVGGQDELVFDGNSLVMDSTGVVLARAKAFKEDLLLTDLQIPSTPKGKLKRTGKASEVDGEDIRVPMIRMGWTPRWPKSGAPGVRRLTPVLGELEEIYRALVLGVQDYVRKNAFSRVLVGISGGIDSALTALIARDALGASNVMGVMMPSPYTSRESRVDARQLGRKLEIEMRHLSITRVFRVLLGVLGKSMQGFQADTTEENLQARIRGTLLMALSNKFGYLVLTTGNKSEMSVGYATLYGDMAGGFAVIKDIPKTKVYELSRWRSEYKGPDFDRVIIPERIQVRAPSAELRPDQTDQDTLPPYPVLDAILQAYVEDNESVGRIVKMGYDSHIVRTVMGMVDRSEYKRRQAPVGIKITSRALGKDRRMPITNRYFSGA